MSNDFVFELTSLLNKHSRENAFGTPDFILAEYLWGCMAHFNAADDRTHADAVTHTSTLVEQHRITIPAGSTGDNVAVARLHAEAYARARGFELRAGSIGVVMRNSTSPHRDDEFLGVTFDVVVGKGDIHHDQRIPGVLDRWTWSGPAVAWWRNILNRADGREGPETSDFCRNCGKPIVLVPTTNYWMHQPLKHDLPPFRNCPTTVAQPKGQQQ